MASLDLVYVNERLIAMKLPVDKRSPPVPETASASAGGKERGVASSVVRPQQDGNDIDVIAALLRSRHAGHYMVWNVSEESYDYSMFEDQVCITPPVLSTCPLRINGGCGKERRI